MNAQQETIAVMRKHHVQTQWALTTVAAGSVIVVMADSALMWMSVVKTEMSVMKMPNVRTQQAPITVYVIKDTG